MTRKFKIFELLAEMSPKDDGSDYTATDIARHIGVSHNTVLSYARNEVQQPKLEIVFKIAAFFGVTIDELFTEDASSSEVEAPSVALGAAL